jgi:hypothetical protein
MSSDKSVPTPRYSVRATARWVFGLDRAVRLEFYDDEIRIYQRHFKLRRDSDYSLLRRIKYSDIRRCEYLSPRVESSRFTVVGFVWAEMSAEIELSIPRSDANPHRQGGDPFWRLEQLRFGGREMTEREFNGMYAWLRAKLEFKPNSA